MSRRHPGRKIGFHTGCLMCRRSRIWLWQVLTDIVLFSWLKSKVQIDGHDRLQGSRKRACFRVGFFIRGNHEEIGGLESDACISDETAVCFQKGLRDTVAERKHGHFEIISMSMPL